MIIVRLMGGIGNQMFQYAFARRLACENNMVLKLDIVSGFEYDAYKREYALGSLKIWEQYANTEELPWSIRLGRFLQRAGLRSQIPIPDFRGSVLAEKKEFVYAPEVTRIDRPVYVFGYWQSEKYFKPIENIIRSEFVLQNESHLKEECGNLVKEMSESPSVAIHVRRYEDIVTGGKRSRHIRKHRACSLNYYKKAIALMASKIENPRFFLFSDNPEWCKSHLEVPCSTRFVSENYQVSDIDEIRLMSYCQHHIISNSTFGWWGAWLNENPEKVVISPARWYNKNIPTPDLLPQKWITIK